MLAPRASAVGQATTAIKRCRQLQCGVTQTILAAGNTYPPDLHRPLYTVRFPGGRARVKGGKAPLPAKLERTRQGIPVASFFLPGPLPL